MTDDENEPEFTHIEDGEAQMVDVTDKDDVRRESTASGRIRLRESTVDAIRDGDVEKGNVVSTARIAAIQAVKHTWEDVPMCHQIPVTGIDTSFEFEDTAVVARVEVTSTGKTGVEMEALNGVTRALLTVWDMVKSAEKNDDGEYPETRIEDVRVEEKVKGQSR
ncbi:MAG: cyclic pyranopterin monophosphate synthase MoaC [Halobacteriales archaeon]